MARVRRAAVTERGRGDPTADARRSGGGTLLSVGFDHEGLVRERGPPTGSGRRKPEEPQVAGPSVSGSTCALWMWK